MSIKEALDIIEEALGKKVTDKRLKTAKAFELIRNVTKWHESEIDRIIEETMAEFDDEEEF